MSAAYGIVKSGTQKHTGLNWVPTSSIIISSPLILFTRLATCDLILLTPFMKPRANPLKLSLGNLNAEPNIFLNELYRSLNLPPRYLNALPTDERIFLRLTWMCGRWR